MEWYEILIVIWLAASCFLGGYQLGRLSGLEKGIEIGKRFAKGVRE